MSPNTPQGRRPAQQRSVQNPTRRGSRAREPAHMKTNFIIVALIAAAAASASFADDKKKHEGHAMSAMAHALMDKNGAEFEAAYLALMVQHHEGGAKMWALVRGKATDETLKELERRTVPKEREEIAQMTKWLEEWHSKKPADIPEPSESKEMMQKDMVELGAASGKQFDALFASKMAHHHMGAIEMGKAAAKKAQHDRVKESAREIVESQTKDREKLLEVAKEQP